MESQESMRVLIYSHDSFGLGHLRRCQAIAHSLVERRRDLSVRMLCDDSLTNPKIMACAIRALPYQPMPSQQQIPGLLDGFAMINAMVDQWLLDAPNKYPTLAVVSEAS